MEEVAASEHPAQQAPSLRAPARGVISAAALWVAAALASIVCFGGELGPQPDEQLLMQQQTPQDSRPEPKRDSEYGSSYSLSLA